MITKEQDEYLLRWLKLTGLKQQEIHDEFYDHIVTSFEQAQVGNPNLIFKEYVNNVIQPDFGGVDGIKKIICRQTKEVNKYYRKQLKANFRSYFRWPMILVVISIFLILTKSLELFDMQSVIFITIMVSMTIPILIGIGGYFSFYFNCKKEGMNYTNSIKNNIILTHLLFLSWVAQFPNWVKMAYGRDLGEVTSPILPLLLAIGLTFLIIISLSYLKLIRDHFDFKLNFA